MLIPSGQTNLSRPPKAALDCRLPIHKQPAPKAPTNTIPVPPQAEPENGLPKAAPENRILARSCGKTEADEDAPEIWVVPITISAPEADRKEVAPRTAANTTDFSIIVSWIYR